MAAVVCSWASPAAAGRSRALALGDMAGRAGRIFVGQCTGRMASQDEGTGLPITIYTFAVTEPIKGVGRGPTTFRVPGTPKNPLVTGMPVFEVGERAVVLLYPESPAGFSTAMGLGQGRFRIVLGPRGSQMAVNDRGNGRLFLDVPRAILHGQGLEADRSGPVDLSALVAVLRALTRGEAP